MMTSFPQVNRVSKNIFQIFLKVHWRFKIYTKGNNFFGQLRQGEQAGLAVSVNKVHYLLPADYVEREKGRFNFRKKKTGGKLLVFQQWKRREIWARKFWKKNIITMRQVSFKII